MTLGADRAGCHQIAVRHPADACILDPVALKAARRRHRAVIVNIDDVKPVRGQFDRQKPRQRGQRHDLPSAAAQQELARIGRVGELERPGIEHETPAVIRLPPDRVNLPVANWLAQRLGHPHHHQEVARGKTGHSRVERSQDICFGIKVTGERRLGKIDIVGNEHEPVNGELSHGCSRRVSTRINDTAVRRGWLSMK